MIDRLRQAIEDSDKIVFFTGAGMSTDSGIPDFRSETGLYKNDLHAEEIISHSYFMMDPQGFFEFYKDKMVYEDAKPNYGHIFIAELEKRKDVKVVTQNIDGLHQAAGSSTVYGLHGSIHRNYCMRCHRFYSLADIMKRGTVPHCECGGIIKPDVVLYEEGLDPDVINASIDAIAGADLLVILGTSLNVYPAAGFINYFRGRHLAIINRSVTPKDRMCDIVIHDSISDTFRALAEKAI
ncbi:MAG: NAD-dependent protein deacylase [Erysipelotrichaceae bacterium]|nr:NAD-dependent protein deacylase [Erysipelotrichaceae bacterium]